MEIIKVKDLKKHFIIKKGPLGKKIKIKAVNNVDFSIKKNRIFALVGESGCGKSTIANLVLRLVDPTSGEVLFKGADIFSLKGTSLMLYRRSVQIVFQDPFASLNPRMRIVDTLSEPLKIHKTVPKIHFKEKVSEILDKVGLNSDVMNRYPHEFSGGQRQRICIARSIILSPEVIIADEPLSSLDVSIQAQIINLLNMLRTETGISFLFISHDLNVVQYFSDEIGVMYLGKIVEKAHTDEFFQKPLHPYSEMLLESMPKMMRDKEYSRSQRQTSKTVSNLDVPSPSDIPSGCPFHPRCHRKFEPCDRIVPLLKEKNGRLISCHLWN